MPARPLPWLVLFMGCEVTPTKSPVANPTANRDPCCQRGAEVSMDACLDTPIAAHVCRKDKTCCEGIWKHQCIASYRTFAGTCTDAVNGADEAQTEVVKLSDRPQHSIAATIRLDPAPETVPGNMFYAGFLNIDKDTHRPSRDTTPVDYGTIGFWLRDFPLKQNLELYEGLHYFVLYGQGEFATADDRMSDPFTVTGSDPIDIVIGPSGKGEAASRHMAAPSIDLDVHPLRELTVHLHIEPPPDEEHTVFYGGFEEVEDNTGTPSKGAQPIHFGTLGVTANANFEAEAALHSGLHYFFFLGAGEHPQPGARMSHVVKVEAQDEITAHVLGRTIPQD